MKTIIESVIGIVVFIAVTLPLFGLRHLLGSDMEWLLPDLLIGGLGGMFTMIAIIATGEVIDDNF